MINLSWSNESQNQNAKNIKDKIYEILKNEEITINFNSERKYNYKLHIYLQGSYKKNIDLKDSDIDILVTVARLPHPNDLEFNDFLENKKWQENYKVGFADGNFEIWGNSTSSYEILKNLGNRSIYGKTIETGKQEVTNILIKLKNEIRKILKKSNEFNIIENTEKRKRKGLRIKLNNEEFDIIPSIIYFNVNKDNNLKGIGITIYDQTKGKRITNYPTYDWENTNLKHKNTDQKYKKIIRIIKGYVRNYNIDIKGFAIEQFLYNVPNNIFIKNYELIETLYDVLSWIYTNINLLNANNFKCTNEIKEKCNEDYKKIEISKQKFKNLVNLMMEDFRKLKFKNISDQNINIIKNKFNSLI